MTFEIPMKRATELNGTRTLLGRWSLEAVKRKQKRSNCLDRGLATKRSKSAKRANSLDRKTTPSRESQKKEATPSRESQKKEATPSRESRKKRAASIASGKSSRY